MALAMWLWREMVTKRALGLTLSITGLKEADVGSQSDSERKRQTTCRNIFTRLVNMLLQCTCRMGKNQRTCCYSAPVGWARTNKHVTMSFIHHKSGSSGTRNFTLVTSQVLKAVPSLNSSTSGAL